MYYKLWLYASVTSRSKRMKGRGEEGHGSRLRVFSPLPSSLLSSPLLPSPLLSPELLYFPLLSSASPPLSSSLLSCPPLPCRLLSSTPLSYPLLSSELLYSPLLSSCPYLTLSF